MIVRIEVLGGLRVRRGARTTRKFRTRQAAGVLAFLACHRDEPASRDTLLEVHWPGQDPARTRQRLSQALSSLRALLEPAARERGTVLQADRDTVSLDPSVQTDLSRFRSALEHARGAPDAMARDRFLDQAIHAYSGPLLPDRFDEWVLALRHTLETQMFEALTARRDTAVRAGDLTRALDLARQAAQLDPLDEQAHAEMFRLLLQNGQRSQAKRGFAQFESRLRTELGISPSPDTARIIESATPAPVAGPRARPLARPSSSRFEEGATLCLVALEVVDSADASILVNVLRTLGDRVAVEHLSRSRRVVGFLRASDALAAVAAFRAEVRSRTKATHRAPNPSKAPSVRRAPTPSGASDASPASPASPASIALAIAEATFERGRFRGAGVAEVQRILGVTGPGWTVATLPTMSLLEDPESLTPRDLGAFEIEGVRASALFALVALSDAPEASEPLSAARVFRSNLAPVRSRFFGRTAEIDHLLTLLRAGSAVVTVLGPGGAGKTRLAQEVVERAVPWFPGGIWFAGLESVEDPDTLVESIAAALGLSSIRGSDPLDSLAERLDSQTSLLVLDNLEQLLPGAAPALQELTSRLRRTTVLMTSRRPTSVSAEQCVVLPPLPVPDPDDRFDEVSESPSVRLFLDRARQREPDFRMTSRNGRSIVELVRALDGLPLALELAAARIHVMTPTQILRRFRRRMDPDDRAKARTDRHQSLTHAIDWSYRLLDARGRHAFVGLGTFRGGFDLEAAEAITEEPLIGDLLADLVDSSLVVSEVEDGPRFRLLETMREYALEKQSARTRERLVDRHAAHYQQRAERVCPQLVTNDAPQAIAALDREAGNLAAALDHLQRGAAGARSRKERARSRAAALDLVHTLSEYWSIRGRFREALATLRALVGDDPVRDSPPDLDPRRASLALFHAGTFAEHASRYEQADAYLAEAARRFESTGDRDYLARTHKARGVMAFNRGQLEVAEQHHRASLEIHRELGDRRAVAQSIQNIGNVLSALGRHTEARAHFEETLRLKREVGSKRDLASALMGLGNVAERLADFDGAIAYHTECLAVAREMRDERAIAMSLANLGSVTARRGELDRGLDLLLESAQIHERIGATVFAANSLLKMALLPGIEARAEWVTPLLAAGQSITHALEVSLPDDVVAELDGVNQRLRDALGPARFIALCDVGRAGSTREILETALETRR